MQRPAARRGRGAAERGSTYRSRLWSILLDALAGRMGGGVVELLTSDLRVIATLRLSSPAAGPAVDGELTLDKTAEGVAQTSGVASIGRLLAADGVELC